MSHQGQRRLGSSKGKQLEEQNSLLSLPLAALSLVHQLLDAASYNSVLCSSREGRDLVLGEARSIRLKLKDGDTPALRKPLVRLLNRACKSAEDGRLSLVLDASSVLDSESQANLFQDLLAPALGSRGWASVNSLELQVGFCMG
jgi:hypothetical protein